MTAFEEFFLAAREAFGRNRDTDWAGVGLLLGLAVLLALGLSVGLRRWQAQRRVAGEIEALAASGGLDGEDVDFLGQIARAAGLPVLEVMTSLATFEHATAAALTSESPVPRPAAGSQFERVRRLRQSLGFASLAPHLWLLTTRELAVGDRVALGAVTGQVVEQNEACFAVDLPAATTPALGTSAALTIDRVDDARYLTKVRVLAIESTPGRAAAGGGDLALRRVFLAHDEQPERQQQREHVRVHVDGPVMVRLVDSGIDRGASTRMAGTLVDVSAGGLSLDLPSSPECPLRRGARIRCSFMLGEGQSFDNLGALVVAATAGPSAGLQHLRASFIGLTQTERDALAAAVAKQQRSLAHVSHATSALEGPAGRS